MSNKENTSEEIDLGQLFKMIGDGFKKLFNLIGNIFKGIFHALVLFLQYIRAHFIKFAIAGLVGVGIGWYWDSVSDPIYRSNMVVEPNFNSVQQLYNNIEFYNDLAKEKEFQSLAEALGVEQELASTIKKFKIESFSDQTQRIKQFSDFISQLDTISQQKVDYEDYLKNFNDINSRFHKITVEATNPTVAKKSQRSIIRSIETNEYFQLQKKINELNLSVQDSVLTSQIKEVDSLQGFVKKLKLLEANKAESSTSISMGEGKSDENLEIQLLNQASRFKAEIVALNKERAKTQNTINIISEFPQKGVRVNEFFRKKKVLLPILLIGLVLITLSLLSLNSFLKTYSNTKA
ncbi:hypothetical protein [Aquimarina brevivitae]|uniref:Subunit length determinant protein n=1 Tax=Aquimarina brevivitae TaxID=323412 RepID=A0A4Q7PFP9_9FLAO|nr:hypothetical protein [Aquimarina brevivitae]RZS99306.1 hypothetical protein EV197_0515 [Aquimarina brevivitae]